MSKVAVLKEKLEKHQAYYDAKFAEYKQMDESSKKSLNRFARLMNLSTLITKLIIELNTEMMIAVFSDEERPEIRKDNEDSSLSTENNKVSIVRESNNGKDDFKHHLIKCKEILEFARSKGWNIQEFKNTLSTSKTLLYFSSKGLESLINILSKEIEDMRS